MRARNLIPGVPRSEPDRKGSMRKRRTHRLYQAVCVLTVLVFSTSAGSAQVPPGRVNFPALFAVVGRMHNIDADLLAAIAQAESGGDPLSVSPKGALGLMQLMPATASEFSVADPYDPVSNVLGAADFIDYLRRRLAKSLDLHSLPDLLAAYNAGPAAVEKYGGVPPYTETHRYVHRVIEKYSKALAARTAPARLPTFNPAPLPVLRPDAPRSEPIQSAAMLDGDGAVLRQLAQIRHLRGQLAARIALGAGPVSESRAPAMTARSAEPTAGGFRPHPH